MPPKSILVAWNARWFRKNAISCLLLVIGCSYVPVSGQRYSYLHYNVKDGLSGSMVYGMCQDREGFMWFGTETGLSRFDGTHFKNFTVKDGLPDNTIIRIYADASGRVWFAPFKHEVCYYYKGKIYNQSNDPLLKQLKFDGYLSSIIEDDQHNIVLMDGTNIYRISPQGKVKRLLSNRIAERPSMIKISPGDSGRVYFLNRTDLFSLRADSLTFLRRLKMYSGSSEHVILNDHFFCWIITPGKLHVYSALYKLEDDYSIPDINTIYGVNDSIIGVNTINGAFFLNILQRKIVYHFLPGQNVSCFVVDNEGGTWLSTFNNGVYRVDGNKFREVGNNQAAMSVYDLHNTGHTILAGTDAGYLHISENNAAKFIPLNKAFDIPLNSRVIAIRQRGRQLAMATGNHLLLKNERTGDRCSNLYIPVKDIDFIDDKTLVLASSNALLSLRISDFKMDVMWRGRITAVRCINGAVYFGTLNGLYRLDPGKPAYWYGDTDEVLRNRITAITGGDDGSVWVATSGSGVVCLKNDRVIRHINKDNGLSSHIARCVAIDSGTVWVGTDNGLNRITGNSIVTYSTADGLSANMINAILIDENMVYAGTPDGVTCFDKRKVSAFSRCNLRLLGVMVNGQPTDTPHLPELKYGNNSLRIDYAAISFKAAGDILYHYRVLGLDTAWKTTTLTALEFISLPPGRYTLELFATNKFNVKSGTILLKIRVLAPFWQNVWFMIAAVAALIFLTWLVVNKRNKQVRKKEAAQRMFEQKMQDLELKALRAQINPHFIFNCLHSVQEFILDKDMLKANKYLSNFARLIRQTLDNSLQQMIPLSDEIAYLTTYLNLERLRCNDRFVYRITTDGSIIPAHTYIPGMILQPYVENAIRHGVQHTGNQQGEIDICFRRKGATVLCTITDNGIGRKATQALPREGRAVYRSIGMQLTQERIDMMNKSLPDSILLTISDITAGNGMVTGTDVTICFPLIQH
jgi:hypothetical protein